MEGTCSEDINWDADESPDFITTGVADDKTEYDTSDTRSE
jgi:hypothetical protein